MKYVQPYGIADPDAPYVNGDPSIARQGSIPPAEAFEHPMRELVSVIDYSQLVPSDTDLEQVAKSIRSQRMNYGEDTGSTNTLSVAFDPPLASYSIGLPIRVKILNNNTGPTTINAGAGRVAVKKPNGAELVANDILAGGLAELVFDGTAFQMINFGGAGGGGTSTVLVNIPYIVDTSVTPNIITANFSPAITSIGPGTIVMVKAANTNTGPTTLNINALPGHLIYAQGGVAGMPLLPGDIQAGDVLIITYDGTHFWILPNPIIGANITFNVATTADIDLIFQALARKRIQPTVTITIKMATGIYSAFKTYHIDSTRIVVEGTMLAANPTHTEFARTGNSPAARANDSASNIAMLRTRYGSEVHFDNTWPGGAVIAHSGPGEITFKNILITGSGTADAGWNGKWMIGDAFCRLDGVSMWGSNGWSVAVHATRLMAVNSFVCASYGPAWGVGGGTIYCDGCGSFGNSGNGADIRDNAVFICYGTWIGLNGNGGLVVQSGGEAQVGRSASGTNSNITGNATIDITAYGGAMVSLSLSGTTYGALSPALNVEGNYNSIIVQAA